MTDDVQHIFMYFWGICIFSLEKILCILLIGLFVLLLLLFSCPSPIYVLDTVMWTIFSSFVSCLFTLLTVFFELQSCLHFLFACALGAIIYEIFA